MCSLSFLVHLLLFLAAMDFALKTVDLKTVDLKTVDLKTVDLKTVDLAGESG